MWTELKSQHPDMHTPLYLYDLDRLRRNAESFRALGGDDVAFFYATMANPQEDILRVVADTGFGLFVNSSDHFDRALRTGVETNRIVFAGSGHSAALHRCVVSTGATYCADSVAQLQSVLAYAPRGRLGVRVNLGSLLRLTTAEDPAPRLGLVEPEVRDSLRQHRQVRVLHMYVGTNLRSAELYIAAIQRLASLAREFPQVDVIDIGGGFATSPSDHPSESVWYQVVDAWKHLDKPPHLRLWIEPGRAIARSAGTLFTTITDVKKRGAESYVLVDTSATWYPRHLVHGANDHDVVLSDGVENSGERKPAAICGASTFSGDILARVTLPEVQTGDVLEFRSAGAYCEAMHLEFLGMPAPSQWFLENGVVTSRFRGGGPGSDTQMGLHVKD